MNPQDIDYLKNFAQLCLDYFAEDAEYDVTAMWQNLENARKLKERIKPLIPIIDTIIHLPV